MELGDRVVDVRSVLEAIGYEVELDSNGWLCGCCPIHGDQHRSFAVHEDSGNWVCYAGCGTGSLVGLVAEVQGTERREAREWLLAQGEPADVSADALLRELEGGTLAPPATPRPAPLLLYERHRAPRYIVGRGFTVDTLRRFEVGRDPETGDVVIPAFEDGRLVGLITRRVSPAEGESKYDYTRGWAKSEHLFGLDRVEGDEAVLVEGPLDAMWLHQYGYPGVAVLGSTLSEAQARLLRRRVRAVTLAFDEDEAGERCRRKATEALLPYMRVRQAHVPQGPPGPDGRPKKRDVQDCPPEELRKILAEASEAAVAGVS